MYRKRSNEETDASTSSTSEDFDRPPRKKRGLSVSTVEKWILEYDKTLNTATWLGYDKTGQNQVSRLKCKVCQRFVDKIRGSRNFSAAFIDGSENFRTSSFKDHAKTDMHERAMVLLKKEQFQNICDYSPIARSFYRMDSEAEAKIKRKFDLAYVMAKENIAFTKMMPLCQLEERHGVDLGETYKNDMACSAFVDYIAKDLREDLSKTLQESHFFSVQMDGSTDCANLEEELFLAIYFDPHSSHGSVHVRNRFMCVRQPESVNATGLYQCFNRAMAHLALDSIPSKLIGFGCDGASVNMGSNALKGCLQSDRPWIVTFWCLAHRLELSLKDALRNTLFSTIDDILLKVYYVYSKAPKKCRELEAIVTELRACLDQSELPLDGGNRPLRACGTRFIAHKVAALERLIDRFGVYLIHLISLTEDRSVKAADQQKIKGYVTKWRDSKILLGSAVFHDILRPAAILCKALQSDELSVVNCIEAILRTSANIEKLKSIDVEEFPSVKKVLLRIKQSEGTATSERTYQDTELTKYEQGLSFLKTHKDEYIDKVLVCLKDRIKDRETSESDLLTCSLKLLATHGWEKLGMHLSATVLSKA